MFYARMTSRCYDPPMTAPSAVLQVLLNLYNSDNNTSAGDTGQCCDKLQFANERGSLQAN
jgi:hypothetical protein